MSIVIKPLVIDISHHNDVQDFQKVFDFGIRGVINKSSEGTLMVDSTYHTRRAKAVDIGLVWGAYHFNGHGTPAEQVDYFMKAATPDADTLMAFDWEDAPNSNNNMDHRQAMEFMQRLDQKLGRKCKFYSGNRAKEQLVHASDSELDFFKSHDWWVAQYTSYPPVMPKGFKYWLWQYTGDGSGLPPHNVPGIIAGNKGLDINHFDGTVKKLQASWV